jgi:hypothetical protein
MPFSDILKLELPESFPLLDYERFVTAVRSTVPSGSDARREFNGASNIIGWRFRSAMEDKEAYLSSWRAFSIHASFEELYSRERHLFGMFVSGVSCVEAICYACYAVASAPTLLALPFDEEIRRYRSAPKHLLKVLGTTAPGSSLESALRSLVSAPEWDVWVSFRNTMTHRSNIPRIIKGVGGGPPPPAKIMEFSSTWSSPSLDGDEETIESLTLWLTASSSALLAGGASLAGAA